MTPHLDWRAVYAEGSEARAKHEYCDRTMAMLNQRDPEVTATELDEDVSELTSSLEDYYRNAADGGDEPLPPGLDGALQAIFEDFRELEGSALSAPRRPAAELLLRLELDLVANIYRWTGHFPEPTRRLVRHLAERAGHLQLAYPADRETAIAVALTTLITSLAMNHIFRGSYLP
jgi:hypothetical protein